MIYHVVADVDTAWGVEAVILYTGSIEDCTEFVAIADDIEEPLYIEDEWGEIVG